MARRPLSGKRGEDEGEAPAEVHVLEAGLARTGMTKRRRHRGSVTEPRVISTGLAPIPLGDRGLAKDTAEKPWSLPFFDFHDCARQHHDIAE